MVSFRTGHPLLNYLDDYFFVAALRNECNRQVEIFLLICGFIQFPVALEKTFWATTLLTFLGLMLDTVNQVICILIDKIQKCQDQISFFLNKRNKKVILLQFQRLFGSLNFLCRCIIPGRAFLRRLYVKTVEAGQKLQSHHHL